MYPYAGLFLIGGKVKGRHGLLDAAFRNILRVGDGGQQFTPSGAHLQPVFGVLGLRGNVGAQELIGRQGLIIGVEGEALPGGEIARELHKFGIAPGIAVEIADKAFADTQNHTWNTSDWLQMRTAWCELLEQRVAAYSPREKR